VLVVNVSPSAYNDRESLSTLRFGDRCSKITNRPEANTKRTYDEVMLLLKMAEATMAKQQAENDMLRWQLQQGRGFPASGAQGGNALYKAGKQMKQMEAALLPDGDSYSPPPTGRSGSEARPGTAAGPSFLSVADRGHSFSERLPGSGERPQSGLDVLICCPITQRVMSSAVLALDGHTYERQAIEAWFATHGTMSPVSGRRLDSKLLVPNHTIRSIIKMAGLSTGGLAHVAHEALAVQVPVDILDFVFIHTNGKQLAMCTMVCKKWQEGANDDANWCWMMETEYPGEASLAASAREGLATYKHCYKKRHLEVADKRRAQRAAERSSKTSHGMKLIRNP